VITKSERTELRSLVRSQMKTLRAEIHQRATELQAGIEEQIVERFAADDKLADDTAFLIQQAADEANRKANDIMRDAYGDRWPAKHDRSIVTAATIERQKEQQRRQNLRWEHQRKIAAQVAGAEVKLQRQETDLLTRLAIGALESDEARAFLGQIPTVAELVPAVRLAEIEASLRGDQ